MVGVIFISGGANILASMKYVPMVRIALENVGLSGALSYLDAFDLKVRMAEFHLASLPPEHRGGVPERSHTEACIFQSKAALDCFAEAVNHVYGINVVPGFAMSIEQLGGNRGGNLTSLNRPLRKSVRSLLGENWWKLFKVELRDKLTHGGPALHNFRLETGSGEVRTHFVLGGKPSKKEVRADLEAFIRRICECVDGMCELLLQDRSWQ